MLLKTQAIKEHFTGEEQVEEKCPQSSVWPVLFFSSLRGKNIKGPRK